ITEAAVARAREYAHERGLRNVEFRADDVLTAARQVGEASADLVVFTEVTLFLPSYREVLGEIQRILKPGGLLFASFRGRYFNLLYSIRARDWKSAYLVRDAREGLWGGGPTWFTWQTSADITDLLGGLGF